MNGGHPSGADTPRDRLITAHEQARDFYRRHLRRADEPRRYLASRGLALYTQPAGEPWHLGYAPPGWTTLVHHLTTAGYSPTELLAAGLAIRTRTGRVVDFFRDRILFPIHDPHANPIAFIGRAAPTAGSHIPKYLNTPETTIYRKRQALYGIGEQGNHIAAGAAPVLVEGPADVLAIALVHPNADRVALAACGTNLSPHHAALIAAMPGALARGVTTVMDSDPAGQRATERAWQLLHGYGMALRTAALPAGTDPGDLITSTTGAAVLRSALGAKAQNLGHAVVNMRLDRLTARQPDLLRWPEGRIAAARALVSLATGSASSRVIPFAKYIAERTGVGLDTMAEIVVDHLQRHRRCAPALPASRDHAVPGRPADQGTFSQPCLAPSELPIHLTATPAAHRPRAAR